MKQVINILLSFFWLVKCLRRRKAAESQSPINSNAPVFSGTTYAVIVGVSDYKYVHPLSFADQDAYYSGIFCNQNPGEVLILRI